MQDNQNPKTTINIIENGDSYGKFTVEPLPRGLATTVGNPLRRVLLGAVSGSAITWVRISGGLGMDSTTAYHQYSVLPHMKEDVQEFLINVKSIRIKSLSDRPGRLRLEVSGEGVIYAADILPSPDFDIVNPELHLATLNSPEASLSVEFNVEQGTGYQPAQLADGQSIGILPVDAIFAPIRKVNYVVERTRVGDVTQYERLVLEVWTDKSLTPVEAVRKASQTLVDNFFLVTSLGKQEEESPDRQPLSPSISAETYSQPLERLELSSRTFNALRRAGLSSVGELLEWEHSDLLRIRNFGEKSLSELLATLKGKGLIEEEEEEETEEASEDTSVSGSDGNDSENKEEL